MTFDFPLAMIQEGRNTHIANLSGTAQLLLEMVLLCQFVPANHRVLANSIGRGGRGGRAHLQHGTGLPGPSGAIPTDVGGSG